MECSCRVAPSDLMALSNMILPTLILPSPPWTDKGMEAKEFGHTISSTPTENSSVPNSFVSLPPARLPGSFCHRFFCHARLAKEKCILLKVHRPLQQKRPYPTIEGAVVSAEGEAEGGSLPPPPRARFVPFAAVPVADTSVCSAKHKNKNI